MSDIFLSYSEADREKARILVSALEQEGWSVWWDRKTQPGKAFDQITEQMIERAKCVVVLWSKASVVSEWVRAEAEEGKSRQILIPAMLEDEVRIPLQFRYLHAPRLTDWHGQSDHMEFTSLRDAVAELLGDQPRRQSSAERISPERPAVTPEKTGSRRGVPEGTYLDSETGLMWTVEDNGQEITWPQAKAYANHLLIGGYSDWRLPEMYELKKLHDPMGGNRYNVRKPFRLTGYRVWSSTTHGSDGLPFDFDLGGRALWRVVAAGFARALCVRRFGE